MKNQSNSIITESNHKRNLKENIGIWEFCPLLRSFQWDKRTSKIYGIEHGNSHITYENWLNLIHPEDRERINKQMEKAISGEYEFETEFRIILPDKAIKYIKFSALLFKKDGGTIISITGINYEDSDKSSFEENGKIIKTSLISLFDEINISIYITDPATYELLYINKFGKNIWGEPGEKKCYEYLHGRSSPCPFCTNDIIFAEDFQGSYIWDFCNQETDKWFRCIDKPYRWIDGRMVRFEIAIDIDDIKRFEEQLQKSEENQKILLDNIQTQVWYLNDEETYGAVNRAHADFNGKKFEDLAFKNIYDIFPEKIADVCKEGNRIVFQTKKAIKTEEWLLNLYGKERLLSITKSPKLDETGNIEYIVCSADDITEQKRTEEELKKTRERLELAMDVGEHGFWDWNLKTNEIYFSPRYYTMLGYAPGELPMAIETWMSLMHPEDRKKIIPEVKHYVDNGEPYEVEFRLRCKDGEWKWIAGKGKSYISGSDHKFERAVGVHVDITNQKKSEEILKRERQRLSDIIEGTNVGTWEWNVQTNETVFSERWAEMIGYTLEELSPISIDTWIKFTHPDDLEKSKELLEKHFNGELNYYNSELRMKHKNGSWVWILDRGKVFSRTDDGKPLMMMGTHQDITKRKKIEEQLLEATERLELAIDAGSHGTWDWNLETNKVFFSTRYFSMLGYKANELPMELDTWIKLLHPEDHKNIVPIIIEHINNGTPFKEEFRLKCKDGSWKWVSGQGKSYDFSDKGKPRRAVGMHIDISEEKEIKEKLKESEKNFRTFFETIDDLIFVGKPDGKILFANSAVTNKLGYSPDELSSMHIIDLHPKDKQAEAESIITCIFRKERDNCLLPLCSKDGRLLPVETRAWFGAWNGEECVFGISKDLTKEQEAQQKFEHLFRNNPALMALTSAEERTFVDVNNAFLDSLGFTRSEVIGKKVKDLSIFLHPDEQDQLAEKLYYDGRMSEMELQLKRKDDMILTGIFSGETINIQGEPHFLTVMIDITERKIAEKRLEEFAKRMEEKNQALDAALLQAKKANQAKSDFLANMSHEIRTPMNGVIGMTSLLLENDLTEEQRFYAETIRSSGETLLVIINDILDFSKIEAGKLELEILDFNIENLIEDIMSTLALRAQNKGLELIYYLSNSVPKYLKGDPGRLRQILANLINNAIKFTQTGDIFVKVTLEQERRENIVIRFSVKDTGIGIPKEKLNLLFKKFSQTDNSTTRKFGGTGLGLAISKYLSEMMGGKIGVESEEGKGSEFWFTVCLDKQNKSLADESELLTALKGTKVLLVDDNSNSREVLSIQLANWNFEPKAVKDSFQALQALYESLDKGESIKIALVDIKLPGMNGLELGRAIRSNSSFDETNLIMLTSFRNRKDKEMSEKIGFEAYLTKPVRQSDLFNAITSVLLKDNKPEILSGKKEKLIKAKSQESPDISQKKKILLVEDNETNQAVALSMLKKFGLKADSAGNGAEALKILKKTPYDLVLMDLQMPIMDGMEATKLIRSSDSHLLNKDVPIIAMTAHALKGYQEVCFEAGMNDYLTKPVSMKALHNVLKKWLDLQEKTDFLHDLKSNEDISQIFNQKALINKMMGDIESSKEIIKVFIEDIPQKISKMEDYLSKGDITNAGIIAHTIKGASANVYCETLLKLAMRIEENCELNNIQNVNRNRKQMEYHFSQLKVILKSFLQE